MEYKFDFLVNFGLECVLGVCTRKKRWKSGKSQRGSYWLCLEIEIEIEIGIVEAFVWISNDNILCSYTVVFAL